jgi:hypothetical protein
VSQPSVSIGPYVVGEKPVPLVYTFLDSNGNAMDLTGYAAKFSIHESLGAVSASLNASVNAPPTAGAVQYTWIGTEFPTPGHYRARFWVGNSTQRFASVLITFDVADSEGPVPVI